MSLNIEGGLARIVQALRMLGKGWFWIVLIVSALYMGLSGEVRDGKEAMLALLAMLFVAALPAGCLLGIAWLLAGFLEPKK